MLLAEAEQIGSFVPYVGGPGHAYILLPLLENLSTVEETVVRDKAVESLGKVGSQLPDAAINDGFVPLTKVRLRWGSQAGHRHRGAPCASACSHPSVPDSHLALPRSCMCPHPPSQRLATGEWFTSRVSATGLFATAYPRALPSLKAELRQLYSQLCRDETPMVRRAAAQKLGAFAAVVEGDLVSRELMPLFTDLMQDGEHA